LKKQQHDKKIKVFPAFSLPIQFILQALWLCIQEAVHHCQFFQQAFHKLFNLRNTYIVLPKQYSLSIKELLLNLDVPNTLFSQ
jgi:hypothetical protein